MNKELIPENKRDENEDDPFKRVNAYGLMKKKDEDDKSHAEDIDRLKEKDYFNKSLTGYSNTKMKDLKNSNYMEMRKFKRKKRMSQKNKGINNPKSRGKFIESKQMVFTGQQMLVPSTKVNVIEQKQNEVEERDNNYDPADNMQSIIRDE